MAVEPSIDAFDVESVLAFGQQFQHLRRLEPVQANRAFEPILVAPQRFEPEHRKRFDDCSIDAGVFSRGRRRREPAGEAIGSSFAMLAIEKQ